MMFQLDHHTLCHNSHIDYHHQQNIIMIIAMKEDHLASMCQLDHQHLKVNLLPGNLLQHLKLGPLDQDHDEYRQQ